MPFPILYAIGVIAVRVVIAVAPVVIKVVLPKALPQVVKQIPKAAKQVPKAAKGAPKKGNTPLNKYKDKAKTKKKKGPCDHLKKGNGKGDYRGGAHSETSKPKNDGKDSHHMPADKSNPLPTKDGPAIQMDPKDHKKTTSNGNNGAEGRKYRDGIKDKIAQGKWRDVMATEIKDARRVARKSGDPTKYNQAIKESLAYFKCLEKYGLLKK